MQHVKTLLFALAREQKFDLRVSKQQCKRMEAVELLRDRGEQSRQELAFNSRPFVLCGLPVRRPPSGTLRHVRWNGRFRLEVTAHPDYGLPFGQDRLIPIWVATLAVRQRSRIVTFRSAAQMLEEFDLPKDGPHYRRMVEGFKRIFTSTIYFGVGSQGSPHVVWDATRFHFFDRLRIWCKRSAEDDENAAGNNIIGLSEAFWSELQAHPIPVDVRVVRTLTNIPGCLDLYMWLCWRCHQSQRTETIPLFGPRGLVSQLGVGNYSRDRNFRKRLQKWLRLVRLCWSDCPARIAEDGQRLVLSPACGIKKPECT